MIASCGLEGVRGGGPLAAVLMVISAGDEDDSVGGCGVSPDVVEVGGDACSTVNWMTGCDGMLSVTVVGGSVDEDECTCSWERRGSGVGDRDRKSVV